MSVLQLSTKLLRQNMFVKLLVSLDAGHEDTLSSCLGFAVCSSMAPTLVFGGQSGALHYFCQSSSATSTGIVQEYEACLFSRQQSSAYYQPVRAVCQDIDLLPLHLCCVRITPWCAESVKGNSIVLIDPGSLVLSNTTTLHGKC